MFFYRYSFYFILIFYSFSISSQELSIKIKGKITDDLSAIVDANIIITQNSKIVNKLLTDATGHFSFSVPFGVDYLITVSKDEFVSKKFDINTNGIPPEKSSSNFKVIQADITLFKRMKGVDYSILDQPIIKYSYNAEDEVFDFDEKLLQDMLNKIETIHETEDDITIKQRQEETVYKNIIKLADKAFSKEDWQSAIVKYQEANKINPKDSYPLTQLDNITKLVSEKLAAENKAKADKALADKALADKAAADKLASDKAKSDKAKADKAAADKAIAEKAAADKLASENNAKAESERIAKEKLAADAILKSKAEADRLAADKLASENKAKLDLDKKLKEISIAESTSKTKVEADRLAKEKSQMLEYKFIDIIAKADKDFSLKRYIDAKNGYVEALLIKVDDSYSKGRVLECVKLLGSDSNQNIDERQKQLLAKYKPGVTEEIISLEGVVIVKRVLVKNKVAYVYEKKIFNWGGVSCYRDNESITLSAFDIDTKK